MTASNELLFDRAHGRVSRRIGAAGPEAHLGNPWCGTLGTARRVGTSCWPEWVARDDREIASGRADLRTSELAPQCWRPHQGAPAPAPENAAESNRVANSARNGRN